MSGEKCSQFQVLENERIRAAAEVEVVAELAAAALAMREAASLSATYGLDYRPAELAPVRPGEAIGSLRTQLANIQRATAAARATIEMGRTLARKAIEADAAKASAARGESMARNAAAGRDLQAHARARRDEREAARRAELEASAVAATRSLVDDLRGRLLGLSGGDVEAVRGELAAAAGRTSLPTDLERRVQAAAVEARARLDAEQIASVLMDVLGQVSGKPLEQGFLTGEPQLIAFPNGGAMTVRLLPETGDAVFTPTIVTRPGEILGQRELAERAAAADQSVCNEVQMVQHSLARRGVRNVGFRMSTLAPQAMPVVTAGQATARTQRVNVRERPGHG